MATLGSTTITTLSVFNNVSIGGTTTFTGKTTHNGGIGTTTLTASGASIFTGKTTHNGGIDSRNILPTAKGTYNLGSSSMEWGNLYVQDANISNILSLQTGTIKNGSKEIIVANDRFELGKGFTDKTLWFNALDYKFNTNTTDQALIISSNGRVGIGDVGGYPAEKLHISDGYVIANGYKLWTNGVDTANSDGYVVMTNGTYKSLSDIIYSPDANPKFSSLQVTGTSIFTGKTTHNGGIETNTLTSQGDVSIGGDLIVNSEIGASIVTAREFNGDLTGTASKANSVKTSMASKLFYICGSISDTEVTNTLVKRNTVYINTSSAIYASGGFYESSDERLKTFIKPINIDLDKLSKLRKDYFVFNTNKNKVELGVSAQEIQELYPEIINTDDNGYLSVAYDKLSVIALAAIDELNSKNKELEERLSKIEKLLALK
jgi:hypothetical protein